MKLHVLLFFLTSTTSGHSRADTLEERDGDVVLPKPDHPVIDGERWSAPEDNVEIPEQLLNISATSNLKPPFFLHADELWNLNEGLLRWPRDLFSKRDYQCPTGTTNCSSIARPNSCCGQGQQCILVQNTGSGDVGCCPSGSTCGNAISTCNTAAGYSSCPSSSNGGCCIPGYTCDSIGCIATGTTTASVSGSTIYVVSDTLTPTILTTVTTTAIVSAVAPSPTTTTIVMTTTITPVRSTYYSTTTTPTSTTTLVVLGSTATATSLTTVTASPAVLATTDAATCAVGYYQCSAFVKLCCQVGIGCDSSSCLTTATSTTVVSTGAVTIVLVDGSAVTTVTPIPTTANSSQATSVIAVIGASSSTSTTSAETSSITNTFGLGSCASAWYSCAANNGGGCCPTGYSCAASCVATQTGIPNHVYKVAPSGTSSANRIAGSGGLLMYALAMMMLTTLALCWK